MGMLYVVPESWLLILTFAIGFTPFAVIDSGMENADKFYSGYGESPDQVCFILFVDVGLAMRDTAWVSAISRSII